MKVKPLCLRRISVVEVVTDTRELALDFMQRALVLLDTDPSISPLVGSQLQLAIDRLASSPPRGSTLY